MKKFELEIASKLNWNSPRSVVNDKVCLALIFRSFSLFYKKDLEIQSPASPFFTLPCLSYMTLWVCRVCFPYHVFVERVSNHIGSLEIYHASETSRFRFQYFRKNFMLDWFIIVKATHVRQPSLNLNMSKMLHITARSFCDPLNLPSYDIRRRR